MSPLRPQPARLLRCGTTEDDEGIQNERGEWLRGALVGYDGTRYPSMALVLPSESRLVPLMNQRASTTEVCV